MGNITPSMIIQYVNYAAFAILGIGFIIGLIRGLFKATYRLAVSLIIIVGCWFAFPLIMNWLVNFDLSSLLSNFGLTEWNGHELTTLKDLFEFMTEMLLGLIEQNSDGSWTVYAGDIIIAETQVYGLIYGLFEMVFRLIFIILILVLNWSLFRFIFGIIYLIIKPKKKKKDPKTGKKKKAKPSGLSRLFGGVIGTVNAVFILFLICVPLSGVFSIASSVGSFAEMSSTTSTEKDGNILYLSIGGEVVYLSEATLEDFKFEDLGQWSSIYRNSFAGQLFSFEYEGEAIDNRIFDGIFRLNVQDTEIKFRKEITTCVDSLAIIGEKLYEPLKENDFEFDLAMLDTLEGKTICDAADKLAELKLIQIVVPIGVEFISNNAAMLDTGEASFINVADIVDDLKDASLNNVISGLGHAAGNLLDAVHNAGLSITDLLNEEDMVDSILDKILNLKGEDIAEVINAIASIQILDALSQPLTAYLEKYVTDNLTKFLLMKPKLTVGDDGFIYVSDQKTNIRYNDSKSLDDYEILLSDKETWIIDETDTGIDGSKNNYKLDFSDVSISQEIRNLGNIFIAFQGLGISSINDFTDYFSGEKGALDWTNIDFDYEHLERLFSTIVGDPDDYLFSYVKVIDEDENESYEWHINYKPADLAEWGITISNGTPVEGDQIYVHVTNESMSGGITVVETTPEVKGKGVKRVDVNKDKFLASTENYYNVGSKLISSNTRNIYCLVNNVLPASMRESLVVVPINGGDIASLIMAAKILVDAGIISTSEDETPDYVSALTNEELVNDLIEAIMNSNLLDKNLTTVINSLMLLAVGEPIIEINEEDWSENKADDIKTLFKLFGKVFQYKDKFGDFDSLSEEDLKDLFGAIGDALSCGIVSSNMNKLIEYLNSQNVFGDFKLKGMDKKYWTKDEATYLSSGLMIFVDLLKTEDSNIMTQFFQLTENESIDSLLRSRFLVTNISANLYIYAGEGGALSGFLCLDGIDEDSEEWFDVIDKNGNIQEKGELRLLLENASKLFKDIADMSDTDALINTLITNIATLSNNIGEEDDDIGKILESIILTDTLAMFMKSLPERTGNVIQIDNPENIEWRDKGNKPGEVRKALKSISMILIDEEGNSKYNDLLNDNIDSKFGAFFNLTDDEVYQVLDSQMITDTIKGFILDYSEGENAYLYVRERNRTEEEWSDCLAQFVISARILLKQEDADGNVTYSISKLNSTETSSFLGLLIDMTDEQINDLTKSDIIVDTIADKIIKYSDNPSSAIDVPPYLKDSSWTTSDWRLEVKNMIVSLKLMLGGDSSKFDELSNGADSLINMITKLADDEDPTHDGLHTVVQSDVIVATFANQILEYGSGSSAALDTSGVEGFNLDEDLEDWRQEEEQLIRSAKALLADEEGNVSLSDLGKSTDNLFEMIINLPDEELDFILQSIIFTDTIGKNIRSFEGTLEVSGTDDYKTDEWRHEIKYLITSTKMIIAEKDVNNHYSVDISSLSDADKINDMINKITHLSNDITKHGTDEDELGTVTRSVIIADTFIKQLKNQATLTIRDDKPEFKWHDNYNTLTEGELRKFIASLNKLFGETVDIKNLDADSIMKSLRGLKNHFGEEDDEVGPLFNSMVLKDTMIGRIIDLDGSTLVVPYNEDAKEWVDYENNLLVMVPGELREILQALDMLFGGSDSDFSSIASSLTVDDLLNMPDSDIEELFGSAVVKYTAAKESVSVLTSNPMNNYIELDKDYEGHTVTNEEERYEMVAEDFENLIFTLKDLKKYGVDYNTFSYEKMQDAYDANGNKVPDTLQRSKLIVHSLGKMMNSIFDESVSDSTVAESINTNLADDEWKTFDSNNREPFEDDFDEISVTETGELRKVFALMDSVDTLTNSFDLTSGSTKQTLKDINHSKVLHNVIPNVIDNALTTMDEWKYAKEDSRDLTMDEWDNEIDIFTEIINIAGDLNMNNLDITQDIDTLVLGKIIKLMALSRYLNVTTLATKVKTGIESTFSGNISLNVNDDVYNYTPKTETLSSYQGKISTWNGDDITITLIKNSSAMDPDYGEVDNVMASIVIMRTISYTDITNIIPNPFISSYSNARASAIKLGNFLDKCSSTRMLEDVPEDIFTALNLVLSAAYCDTISYNKAAGAGNSTYCYTLLVNYVEANNANGKYN